MATRPIFIRSDKKPYYQTQNVDFKFYPGFSVEQKRKSIDSLHKSFMETNSLSKILEISTKSPDSLGVKLSAFKLLFKTKNEQYTSVESAFQSSKIFEFGGPYTDLLYAPAGAAKADERLRNSGNIIGFEFEGEKYPPDPKTFFYDWLYISAIASQPELIDEIQKYDAFTDIEFNPKKSINCQARTAAILSSLIHENLLEKALESKQSFIDLVYDPD